MRRRALLEAALGSGHPFHHLEVHGLLVELEHQRQGHSYANGGGDGQEQGCHEGGDHGDL